MVDKQEVFSSIIKPFDDIYAKKRLPIYKRPQIITEIIVDKLLLEVSNIDIKTEAGKTKAYILVLHQVVDWYEKKYGKILVEDPSIKDRVSFVIYKGSPMPLSLPMTINYLENDKIPMLEFPEKTKRNENILSYLNNEDFVKSLSIQEKKYLKNKIKKVLDLYREINSNILSCKVQIQKGKIITDIWKHLDIAAKNITEDYLGGISFAIWELFFSVELTLKMLYYDKYGKQIGGHNIGKIIKSFTESLQVALDGSAFIKKFPDDKMSIKYRYAELVEKDIYKVNAYYIVVLQFILTISKLFSREYRFKNLSISLINPYIV